MKSYAMRCRLSEIMQERRMTIQKLHEISGVHRQAIIMLKRNTFTYVHRDTVPRICRALAISIEDLFGFETKDIWFPIKLSRQVTFHLGTNAAAERWNGPVDVDALIPRESVGSWDVQAVSDMTDYLNKFGLGITGRLMLYPTEEASSSRPYQRTARMLFDSGGCHIVLASPRKNALAEEVVCLAYGLPAFSSAEHDRFEYNLVWDSSQQQEDIVSSLGYAGPREQCGIIDTRTKKLVARHTVVAVGEGEDCGLIVVRRIAIPPARRRLGPDEEGIVIAILGHGGPGTLASARVAMDSQAAAELYPPSRSVPCMRATGARYRRRDAAQRDNRELLSWWLVEEDDRNDRTEQQPNAAVRKKK